MCLLYYLYNKGDRTMDNEILDLLEQGVNDTPANPREVLSALAELVDKLDELDKEEARLTEAANKVAAERRVLVEEIIPSLMTENGFTSVTLDDGRKLSYKEEYFAHISKANTPAAMAWLRANGLADIIKNEYKISFSANQTDKAQQFESLLKMSGNEYTNNQAVHPSTLKSMVNRFIAEGNMPPQDIFGIYQKKTATVKTR